MDGSLWIASMRCVGIFSRITKYVNWWNCLKADSSTVDRLSQTEAARHLNWVVRMRQPRRRSPEDRGVRAGRRAGGPRRGGAAHGLSAARRSLERSLTAIRFDA